ncbi:hypothetical protein Hanom_Chr05g00465091 [Helianthus anomalus]
MNYNGNRGLHEDGVVGTYHRDPTRNNYLVPYLFLYRVYGRMDVNEWCWLGQRWGWCWGFKDRGGVLW